MSTPLERLQRMVAWTEDPALSLEEVKDLLFDARRADTYGAQPDDYKVWLPNTLYVVGDFVTPTARNGHYYEVTTGGTSGTAEPTWPTDSGDTVEDGADVVPLEWTEQGSLSWVVTYDLNSAACAGWELKMGKATNKDQYLQDSRGQAATFTYLNCERNAKMYRDKVVQSVPIRKRVYA